MDRMDVPMKSFTGGTKAKKRRLVQQLRKLNSSMAAYQLDRDRVRRANRLATVKSEYLQASAFNAFDA